MKKIISMFLIGLLLANSTCCFAKAQVNSKNKTIEKNMASKLQNDIIPHELESTMKSSIAHVYGKDKVEEIYSNVYKIVKKTKAERKPELIKEDLSRNSDWYKDEIIYMFYPDQFGVDESGNPTTFKDLVGMLDYLKDLGVTTLYIMPFADSPMNDAGFDVKNPRSIRWDLGGMNEFKEFTQLAREKGFKIKADLVLNHFSDQHEWFQQALKGDLDKLNYFIVREDMPEYKSYKVDKIGYITEYKEKDGTITKRRLIFPEISDNHYRKVSIKGTDYYVYHTFYPFQLDINWENPEVLYYVLETLGMWTNLGVDIFRLDAIPYFTKEEGTTAENLPKTHDIIKIISSFVQTVAPRSIIQAEACQQPKQILPYFGSEKKVEHQISGQKKEIKRTDQVQIAYHFPYMPAIWASLVTSDNKYFWKAYKQTPQIPDSAAWAMFLRVHDELTLEMANKETRDLLFETLSPKGAAFRKGYGVSGRLANFLDNNPDRIAMAFSIMLSLPGVPIIYYGDELGIQNNFENAKKSEAERKRTQKNKKNDIEMKSYFDSRDINRGPVKKSVFYDAMKESNSFNHKVYSKIRNLIKVRKQLPAFTFGDFSELKTDSPEVFAYVREYNKERIIVINNLSNRSLRGKVSFVNDDFGKKEKELYIKNMLNGKVVKAKTNNNELSVKLKPYEVLWLKM